MKIKLSALKEYVLYASTILAEGRIEDARAKFPDMEDEHFEFLVTNQPAGSNNKYLMWACKQADNLLEIDPDPMGLRVVIQAIRLFDGNKQRLEKKDLYQYNDTNEIETAVEKLGGASKGQKNQQALSDTDVVYEDDQFLVVRPHTAEASCKFGSNTNWCIAAQGTRNYYNTYSSSNNKFYFIISKNSGEYNNSTRTGDKNSKLAIVIDKLDEQDSRIQVYNAADAQVGLSAAINHTGAKWNLIWSKIKEHAKTNPDTREVIESRIETSQHVKKLLNGENISIEGVRKVTSEAELTPQIINALIKLVSNREVGWKEEFIRSIYGRMEQLQPDDAYQVIKFALDYKYSVAARSEYWSGHYQITTMIEHADTILQPNHYNKLYKYCLDNVDLETISKIVENQNCPQNIIDHIEKNMPDFKSEKITLAYYRGLLARGTITAEQLRNLLATKFNWTNLAAEILYQPRLHQKLTPELLNMIPITSERDLENFLRLPNITPEISAEKLAKYGHLLNKSKFYELLRTTNLPSNAIEKLWNDAKDQNVRIALLQNAGIGEKNAQKFATSKNSAYRFAVAHNTVLPANELQNLAGDESTSTRSAVASNINTPVETLRILASDEAIVVRASVAGNSNTPINILTALTRDNDDYVRKCARKSLKLLQTSESVSTMLNGMFGILIKEDLSDDDDIIQDIMIPNWREIYASEITLQEFATIFLLQNNGSATREEIENAFESWPGRSRYTIGGQRRSHIRGRYRYTRSPSRSAQGSDFWNLVKRNEHSTDTPSRGITSQGSGWWWAPAGNTKSTIYRLTPSGAAAAIAAINRIREKRNEQWTRYEMPPVRRSAAPAELNPNIETRPRRAPAAAAARGPKTTYKIYGKFKGHPVATRLKGQAYVGANNTQFSSGEQAIISPEDGKLRVKKVDSDHSQLWDPIDG